MKGLVSAWGFHIHSNHNKQLIWLMMVRYIQSKFLSTKWSKNWELLTGLIRHYLLFGVTRAQLFSIEWPRGILNFSSYGWWSLSILLPQRLVFSVENYYRAVIKGKRTFLNELVNLKFLLESFGKKTIVCVV